MPQCSVALLRASSDFGSQAGASVWLTKVTCQLICFIKHFCLAQYNPLCAEQPSITSCQASPVADRKRTSTAWGNVWKLLLRWMAVSSSSAIFPKTYKNRQRNSTNGAHKNLANHVIGERRYTVPAFRWQRRWKITSRSIAQRKAEPGKIS